MGNIPYDKKRLEDLDSQIRDTRENLSLQLALRKKIHESIQDSCSHPDEYREETLTNPDHDPLECKHYIATCSACGKVLGSYDMVRGQKQYRQIPC